MAGKYIHPSNCYPGAKSSEEKDHNPGPMKEEGSKYPMPKMNREEGKSKTVKGPEHYRKE